MDSAQCPYRVTEVGYKTGFVRTGGLKRKHSTYHHPDHKLGESKTFVKKMKQEPGAICPPLSWNKVLIV